MTPDRAFRGDVAWWDSNRIPGAAASATTSTWCRWLLPGDLRSDLVQEVTTFRTVIPTDAVIKATVGPILRGTCRGTARDPRTATAPALPVRSPRAA